MGIRESVCVCVCGGWMSAAGITQELTASLLETLSFTEPRLDSLVRLFGK